MKFTTGRAVIALAIPAAAVLGVTTLVAADTDETLTANLKGRNEVSNTATNNRIVGDPNGRGTAAVFGSADPTEVCYSIAVSRIEPATAAHIHLGGPDVAGPVVVTLDPPTGGTSAGCVSGLSEALVANIFANPQDYYVNVHTADYGGGAVRGQLSG